MLATVAAAALGPATGTVSAANSCPYGTCTSSGPGALTWAIGGILAAIILLIAAAVIFQRRKANRPPPGGLSGWNEPTPPGGAESPAAAEAAPYLESPEDVGTMGGGVAVAGGAAAGAGGEAPGDIDSLMGELDRISGEILKRGPGKKGPPTTSDDESGPSGN